MSPLLDRYDELHERFILIVVVDQIDGGSVNNHQR
jgi:hypothetical protein